MGEQQQLLAKTANVPIRSSTGSSTQQSSSQGPSEIELNHYQSVPTSTCGTGAGDTATNIFEPQLAYSFVKDKVLTGVRGLPAILIGLLLNLFLAVSFGQAFFPTDWVFPENVPRSIGVQMFLLSTVICQITLTLTSSFPMAMGQMMVENIPFMHVICRIAIQNQGMGEDTFSTVLVAFSLSTICVGIFFYLLGYFELGNAVYFFPRHVIVGCIGGIGVFLFITGIEGSTNRTWTWNLENITSFFSSEIFPLWFGSFCFEIILRILSIRIKEPLLAPFYFVSIPIIFYFILICGRFSVLETHNRGWFFEGSTENTDFLLIWKLIDFKTVNWQSIFKAVPTTMALTVFSLMHVPINIPSLTESTGFPADMNAELKGHGISNLISGITGGVPNYLCYSSSVTYFKCNGGSKVGGFLLAAATGIFFFIGPSAVYYLPRCMGGCLLMHIGVDLTKEALYDSYSSFDVFEYVSVLGITGAMTFYGMTAGLALGVFNAALAFTLQSGRHVSPIRTVRSARTLRSSKWRTHSTYGLLEIYSRHITVIQLQGYLFFGNATILAAKVDALLSNSKRKYDIRFIVLDFTLVLAIDSSAADTMAKIFGICERYNVKLCYCRSSSRGFPCSVDLSKKLKNLKPKNPLKNGNENKKTENYSEIKKRKSDFGDLKYGKNEFTDVDDVEKFLSEERKTEVQPKLKNENGNENGNGIINKNEKRERRRDGGNKGVRGKIENLNKERGRKQSGNASDNSFEFDVYNDYDKYDDEDDDEDERKRNESRNRYRESKEAEGRGVGGGREDYGREDDNGEKGIRGTRGEGGEEEGEEEEEEEEEELKGVHVADSLDQGLAWCEDHIIAMYGKTLQNNNNTEINDNEDNIKRLIDIVDNEDNNKVNNKNHKIFVPYYLKKIATMCASESLKDLILLFQYFELTKVRKGGILWKVGDSSSSAILLYKGGLISHSLSEREIDENKDKNEMVYDNDNNLNNLNNNNSNRNYQNNGNGSGSGKDKERYVIKMNESEIEDGEKGRDREREREREEDEEHGEDFEEIYIGHLIGEYGLINKLKRQSTLSAKEDSEILVLSKGKYLEMLEKDPLLALLLSRICMALSQKRDVAGWGCPKLVRILRSTAPSRPAMQSWRDEMKEFCKEIIRVKGVENMSPKEIISLLTPFGREKISQEYKSELIKRIRYFLETEEEDFIP